MDPLSWWKVHKQEYPIISRVALRYLAKPSSNSFQERIFSVVGFAERQKTRSRLKAVRFEKLCILRANWGWSETALQALEDLREVDDDEDATDDELDPAYFDVADCV